MAVHFQTHAMPLFIKQQDEEEEEEEKQLQFLAVDIASSDDLAEGIPMRTLTPLNTRVARSRRKRGRGGAAKAGNDKLSGSPSFIEEHRAEDFSLDPWCHDEDEASVSLTKGSLDDCVDSQSQEGSSSRQSYKCDGCGKAFRKKYSLSYHQSDEGKRCPGKFIPPKQHIIRKGIKC